MNVTGSAITREFQRTLDQYKQVNRRERAVIANKIANDVALHSVKFTEKANADKIAWTMGQIGSVLNFGKKGQILKKKGAALFSNNSFAARIINSRRKKNGEPLLFGHELDEAVRKMVAARKRSVAFTASGWLWALADLARARFKDKTKQINVRSRGVIAKGQKKGLALPAVAGVTSTSVIVNSALKNSPGAYKVAERGLMAALVWKTADMKKYIVQKLQKEADKVSVK